MDEERKSHKETVQLNLNADSTPQNSLAQAVEGSSMVNNTSSSESEADDYTHPSDTQVHVSEILNQLRSSDPGEKWNGLKDLCNYWAMCNEETLVGFPINTTLQILLKILQESDSAMPELELMAIRSLLNLYELLSPIHSPLIIQEFVPLLISRLYSIEYIELAESCISLLSKLSSICPQAILTHNGIPALLNYLDFFALAIQRNCLQCVLNLSFKIPQAALLSNCIESVQMLCGILRAQIDPKLSELACGALANLIESFANHGKHKMILNNDLLDCLISLLDQQVDFVSVGPVMTNAIKALGIIAKIASIDLHEKNFGLILSSLLKSILHDQCFTKLCAEHIGNSERPPEQLCELLDLSVSLLPETFLDSKVGVAGSQILKPFEIGPNRYNFDLPELPEFSAIDREYECAQTLAPASSFAASIFPIAIDLYQGSSSHSVRVRCLIIITRACLALKNEALVELLKNIPFANFLSRIIGRTLVELDRLKRGAAKFIDSNSALDPSQISPSIPLSILATTTYGLGLCKIVIGKLPELYEIYFRREGVFFELERLANFAMYEVKHRHENIGEKLSRIRQDIEVLSDEIKAKKADSSQSRPVAAQSLASGADAPELPIIGRGWRGVEGMERGFNASSQLEGLRTLLHPIPPPTVAATIDSPSGVAGLGMNSESMFDLIKRFQILSRSYNSLLPIWLWENLKVSAKSIIRRYLGESTWALELDEHSACEVFRQAKRAADLLLESEDQHNALTDICNLFSQTDFGDLCVTSFELLQSGLADALLSWFSDGDFCGKMSIFVNQMGPPRVLQLVRLLQNSLARLEAFDLEVSIFSNHAQRNVEGNSKFANQLVRPIRLRIKPVEESIVDAVDNAIPPSSKDSSQSGISGIDVISASMKSLAVMLPAGSTLRAVEEFLLKRLEPYFTKIESDLTKVRFDNEKNSRQHQLKEESVVDHTRIATDEEKMRRRRNDSSFVHEVELGNSSNGRSCEAKESNTVLSDTNEGQPERIVEFSVGKQVISSDSTVYSVIHTAEQLRKLQAVNTTQQNAIRTGTDNAAAADNFMGYIQTLTFRPYLSTERPPLKTHATRQSVEPCDETSFLSGERSVIDFLQLPQSLAAENAQGFMKILLLIKLMHAISLRISQTTADNTRYSSLTDSEFINPKLTTKLNQQLADIMICSGGLLPTWCTDLCKHFRFLFPLETRLHFIHSAYYGSARPIMKWIQMKLPKIQERISNFEQDPTLQQLGRISRQKIRIHRDKLFESGLKVLKTYARNNRYMMEIEFFGEEGTGLGPTLEFYSLMSREWQRSSRKMWHVDENARDDQEYINTLNGLFPIPRSRPDHAAQESFKLLGRFLAKAMLDFRLVDIHFHPFFIERVVFYNDFKGNRAVNSEFGAGKVDFSRLANVDSGLAKSLMFIFNNFAKASDETPMEIDFSLPGYPEYAFPRKLKAKSVDAENVEEYVACVVDAFLYRGIDYAVDSFRSGFSEVLPVDCLRCLAVAEIIDLWSSGRWTGPWPTEMLKESIKTDHGFGSDSRSVLWLIEIMASFDEFQQRLFLQFVTGSPKLPIGGFKSLSPPLTVVCKTVSTNDLNDRYLPSVMTCVNYLKLPDYSSIEVMKERLAFAMEEGQGSFHLS